MTNDGNTPEYFLLVVLNCAFYFCSVNKLSPSDVGVVAALGDSLTVSC